MSNTTVETDTTGTERVMETSESMKRKATDEDKYRMFQEKQKEDIRIFMMEQQKALMEMGTQLLGTEGLEALKAPVSKKPNLQNTITIDIHPTNDSPLDKEIQNESGKSSESSMADILAGYSEGRNDNGDQEGDHSSEEDEEDAAKRYEDLLKSTEEPMGEPIEQGLAHVIKTIWGKADDREKNKDYRKVLTPSNCENLKTPRLNAEIYIKLNSAAQDKDRSAQARQKDMVRSTIPLLQAMEKLKNVEKEIKRQIPKEIRNAPWVEKYTKDLISKIQAIHPQLHKSLILQNCAFSENLKKRKGDVCSTLGSDFAAYKSSKSSDEWLFDEDSMKKMKSSLKAVSERKKHFSKNYTSSHKTHRSSYQKGKSNNNSYRKNYQNNNYNSNNSNNSNNKNQSYNNNKNGGNSNGYRPKKR